jgi:F5/8 type C domain
MRQFGRQQRLAAMAATSGAALSLGITLIATTPPSSVSASPPSSSALAAPTPFFSPTQATRPVTPPPQSRSRSPSRSSSRSDAPPSQPQRPPTPAVPQGAATNLALGKPITASSSLPDYPASNADDGNPYTYWESQDGAGFPQTLTVDLGATASISRIVIKLPPVSDWNTRTQTLAVLGSTYGSTYHTLVAAAGYTFHAATGDKVAIWLPPRTTSRFVRLLFTANTGWDAAQLSAFNIFG